jgi:hypothetical protein
MSRPGPTGGGGGVCRAKQTTASTRIVLNYVLDGTDYKCSKATVIRTRRVRQNIKQNDEQNSRPPAQSKIQDLKCSLGIMILTTMPNEGNVCMVCIRTTQRQLKENIPHDFKLTPCSECCMLFSG